MAGTADDHLERETQRLVGEIAAAARALNQMVDGLKGITAQLMDLAGLTQENTDHGPGRPEDHPHARPGINGNGPSAA